MLETTRTLTIRFGERVRRIKKKTKIFDNFLYRLFKRFGHFRFNQ